MCISRANARIPSKDSIISSVITKLKITGLCFLSTIGEYFAFSYAKLF